MAPFSIIGDARPLPPVRSDPRQNEALFEDTDPAVEAAISVNHGLNFKVGKGTFLNFNLLVLDTCFITIGENVLFGPNVCLSGATHPMDPAVWRGLKDRRLERRYASRMTFGLVAGAIILAGVRIGRGSTVGAGSVVTQVGASIQCGSETWANRCRMFPLFALSLVTRPELSDESILRWV